MVATVGFLIVNTWALTPLLIPGLGCAAQRQGAASADTEDYLGGFAGGLHYAGEILKQFVGHGHVFDGVLPL